jgi:uncharacterized heparinase superfamily protein
MVLAVSRRRIKRGDQTYRDSSACALHVSSQELKGADGELNRTIATATGWLNHRAGFFALRDVFLGEQIDWHRDYSSGIVGPKKYSVLINHRDAKRLGDVKYIWELNRLHQLVFLALAATWTGKDAYKEEIRNETASWYEQNPFMIGLNWKSALEAGMRLISWALVWFIMGKADPKQTFHNTFLELIYQHQYFISKFFSKYSSANNHLIGEMAALYISTVCWPYYRESSSWRAFAREKLIEENRRQVEADGVGKERATEYQLFILEFFLLAGALGQAVGDPFPAEYWERVRRMAFFLSAMADRNGHLPLFGDGDSAQVVPLSQSLEDRLRSLTRLYMIDRRADVGGIEEDIKLRLLLWGQRPDQIPLLSDAVVHPELEVFPDGGYYVLALSRGMDDEVIVVFDAGPIGLPPLYAHGHADALSFWLSYGGQEFLIDPGTFCYYTEDVWRAYFRGTAAHNTLRIDGVDQSIPGGRFLWRDIARSHVEQFENGSGVLRVTGWHDGYQRLPDPVMHRRELRLLKTTRTLIVTDFLDCKSSHAVEIFFHFSERCEVHSIQPGSFHVRNGNRRIALHLDPRAEATLYRGSVEPIVGWVSRTFGAKEPSCSIAARTTIAGSTQFVSKINLL